MTKTVYTKEQEAARVKLVGKTKPLRRNPKDPGRRIGFVPKGAGRVRFITGKGKSC